MQDKVERADKIEDCEVVEPETRAAQDRDRLFGGMVGFMVQYQLRGETEPRDGVIESVDDEAHKFTISSTKTIEVQIADVEWLGVSFP